MVNEAKSKYEAAKKAVVSCQSSITELQRKSDSLQESLPGLGRAVEDAERVKESALDAFALSSNKQTETALKAARQAHEAAQKAYSEGKELSEATNRALTKQQAELIRLNNACELVKRQYWQAVFDEIKSAISSEVFESVRRLQVIGSHCGQTRQWILDSLFPSPSGDDFQAIRSGLVGKYGID